MYHTLAYRGTVAATANTAIAGVTDDVISRNSVTNNFMLPEPMSLFGAAAMSATMNRCRINCPTYRMITLPFIRPTITGLSVTDFAMMQLLLDQPLRMPMNEEIAIEGTSDIGAGGEIMTSVLFLGPSLESVPAGDIYHMMATSTTAAVTGAWTTVAYTMADNLPPGRYALVGSEHVAAVAVAHRWIIPNQFYRPGALSIPTVAARSNWQQSNRQFGTMGTFLNTTLPNLQVLCNAATAVHTFFMQLVRIG